MNASAQNKPNPWLHRFAVLTAIATFLLIGLGGLVTSHEAGMSVPDWPNTYGYNMFLFPVAKWIGGIFYEHTHRLLASAVGLLTTVLAVWLWLKDSRKWMRWLGVAAFLGVVAQGILGGLRVTLDMDSLGVFHATIAQLFFVLTCAIALFTSRFWLNLDPVMAADDRRFKNLRTLVFATTLLIFIQLILGATMRHQHAGLAIPDFPLAHGKFWPDTSAGAVARYNADRMDVISENPVTAFQIILQMAHRIAALAILIGVSVVAWRVWSPGFSRPEPPEGGTPNALRRLACVWLALIVSQIALGAWTIWSNKAADVTTLHVMVGALSLVTGALWCIIAFGRLEPLPEIEPFGAKSGAFGTHPALAANR